MTREDARGMLERGFDILLALGNHPDGLALSDVVKEVNLPTSTTHRLLNISVNAGFIEFNRATKLYTLGIKIFELANRVRSVQTISQVARPVMKELSEYTGETVQLAILAEEHSMFVEKIGSDQSVTIRGSIGHREPLYATSSGKILLSSLDPEARSEIVDRIEFQPWTPNTIITKEALLAEVEKVKDQQWAMVEEEFDHHVRAISVPVRNSAETVVAALSVAGPTFRVSQATLQNWLPAMNDAAYRIGVKLPS